MDKTTQNLQKNILIVDDDEIFCKVLKQALQKRKYNVFVTHNLQKTIEFMQTHNPEFAIVDLCIGDDSGLDVIKHLLTVKKEMKVVVLTGFASIATAIESIKMGAIYYLTKPIAVDEIIKAFYRNDTNNDIKLQAQPMSARRVEWEYIQKILTDNNGNISKTARDMNMHRRTLQRKLSKNPVKE